MLKLIDGKLYREETDYFEVLNASPCEHVNDGPLYLVVEDRVFMDINSEARYLSGPVITVSDSNQKMRVLHRYIATNGHNYELDHIFAIGSTYKVQLLSYTPEAHRHIYSSEPKAYPEYFITSMGDMLYAGALYKRIK